MGGYMSGAKGGVDHELRIHSTPRLGGGGGKRYSRKPIFVRKGG